MKQLIRRLELGNPRATVTLVRDLETLRSPKASADEVLPQDLREVLRTVLQVKGYRNLYSAELPSGVLVSDFRRAMVRLIRKINDADLSIVDEVKYLHPPRLPLRCERRSPRPPDRERATVGARA